MAVPAPDAAAAAEAATGAGAVLVTGPARSGKSEWAERLAATTGGPVTYIATAREDPADADWTARIAAHRARRPARWTTVAAPVELVAAIADHDRADRCLLIDSLGTWVANLIDGDDAAWQTHCDALSRVLARPAGRIVLVAEETGWGVIPAYPIGRCFRDRLGGLVRRLGPRCSATWLVVGGHALDLRRLGTPLD